MKDEWERFFISGSVADYLQAKQMEYDRDKFESGVHDTKENELSGSVNESKDDKGICRIT